MTSRPRRGETLAGQPTELPLLHHARAHALVEAQRRLVPIEHRPLHAPASALNSKPGEVNQQPLSDAAPAPFRLDEQILEIETWPSEKRREVVEEQREPGDGRVDVREDHFGGGTLAEEPLPQSVFRRDDLVRQALVFAEPANQLQDDWHVVRTSRDDLDAGHIQVEAGLPG